MSTKKEFSIYRLCRDEKTLNRLKAENEKYGFDRSQLMIGLNYFEFLNKVIAECPDDFALVCHDDVILPVDIQRKIDAAISRADEEFGNSSWGLLGNSGVEFLSLNILRLLRDVNFAAIPPGSQKSVPVVYIDGNTLLLNIKNLREKSIFLPKQFDGYQLYNFVLLAECYKKGLVSAIDSDLFVMHKSPGNKEDFSRAFASRKFVKYWQDGFSNNSIKTINGVVDLEVGKNSEEDFYELIFNTLKSIYLKRSKKNIYIVTRTTLGRENILKRNLDIVRSANLKYAKEINIKVVLSINNIDPDMAGPIIARIKREYSDLDINYLFCEDSPGKFSRVFALQEAVGSIRHEKDSYIWIVDDDDFIFPESLEYFPLVLNDHRILVGNSAVFEEKWDNGMKLSKPLSSKETKIFDAKEYYKCFLGDNYVPICSVIYPVAILKKIFEEYHLAGDYFEDYALILFAQNIMDVSCYPILIAGISSNGSNTVLEKNRTHWDYSYVTFVSEFVNSTLIRNWIYDFACSSSKQETISGENIDNKNILQLELELNFIKTSKFWKMREWYMKLKGYLFFKNHS